MGFLSKSAPAAELVATRSGEHGRFTRVVFEFKDAVKYREPRTIGNGHFYWVFLDSFPASARKLSHRASKGVRSIKLIQKGTDLRADVVLSFPYFRLKTFFLSNPDRVVLDAYPVSSPPEEPGGQALLHAAPVKKVRAIQVQKKQAERLKKSSTALVNKKHRTENETSKKSDLDLKRRQKEPDQLPSFFEQNEDIQIVGIDQKESQIAAGSDMEKEGESSAKNNPLDFSGFVTARGGVDINDDLPHEQKNSFRNIVRLEGNWQPTGTPTHVLASVDSDFLWFGSDPHQEEYDLDLFEGYLSSAKGPLDVTFGKQIIRWGKSDGISPVDTLNGEDLRDFIVRDYDDRKLPNWMIKARYQPRYFTLEGVYTPLFRSSRFDYFGTDWAIFQHLKSDVSSAELPAPLKSYIDNLSVNETKPDDRLENGEWGARVSKTVADWDIGVSYLYAWEKLPFFESFPIKNISINDFTSIEDLLLALKNARFTDEAIETTFKRYHQAGLEFETTAGVFGVRGELAYYDQQSFLTDSLTSVQRPVYHYVIGADYVGEQNWYVNLQFSHQILSSYDPGILYFKRDNTMLTGEFELKFWEGNLIMELLGSYMISDNSYYFSPSLIFKYFTGMDIQFKTQWFGGKPDSIFGRYDTNDELFLLVKYYF